MLRSRWSFYIPAGALFRCSLSMHSATHCSKLQKAGITGLFDSKYLDCLRLFLSRRFLCLGGSLCGGFFCFGGSLRLAGLAGFGGLGSTFNSCRSGVGSVGFSAEPAGSSHQRKGHGSYKELFHVSIRFFWLCHIYNNMAVRLWHERTRDAITNLSLRSRAFAGIFYGSSIMAAGMLLHLAPVDKNMGQMV